jgi:hypothetical protein
VVDVAQILLTVGDEVATIFPFASVERTEFTETAERVRVGVEIDEVAVNVEARTSPPVNTAEPGADSVRYGEDVPIPIFPFGLMINEVRVDDPTTN